MDLDLKGKTAIVCGSTQGIGKASVEELALLGANVTLVARNEDKMAEVCRSLNVSQGHQHNYLVADFAQTDTLEKAIERYLQTGQPVYILVNNTSRPTPGPVYAAQAADFRRHSSAIYCAIICCTGFVPLMKVVGYGRIVKIISTSVKQPIPGARVSNTIRGAIANWAKTLSLELAGYGITVNNVLPGQTRTSRLDSVIQGRSKIGGSSRKGDASANSYWSVCYA